MLFHNYDAPRGPRRMFDVEEWRAYRDAYLREVTLTELERERWPSLLEAAWLDEGLYALLDAKQEWGNPGVLPWLESLLHFQAGRFPLD